MENLIINSLIAIALGFLIGLERNIYFNEENVKSFAGSRTFALISLIGYISVYLTKYFSFFIYTTLFGVFLLITSAYLIKPKRRLNYQFCCYFSTFIFLLNI